MSVKLYYRKQLGDRGPQILTPRAAHDPRAACLAAQFYRKAVKSHLYVHCLDKRFKKFAVIIGPYFL